MRIGNTADMKGWRSGYNQYNSMNLYCSPKKSSSSCHYIPPLCSVLHWSLYIIVATPN